MAHNIFGLQPLEIPARRSVFVSFHHANDQYAKDQMTRSLSQAYQVIDRSLNDAIDTNNSEYAMRAIGEKYISGTSATIVICGSQTHLRKFVDWEIKATLDKQHGLIGVYLDSAYIPQQANYHCPSRLVANIHSGYATWCSWNDFTSSPTAARGHIEKAIASNATLIRNQETLKPRNG